MLIPDITLFIAFNRAEVIAIFSIMFVCNGIPHSVKSEHCQKMSAVQLVITRWHEHVNAEIGNL